MWLLIAVPLTIILTIAANCYLQRKTVFKRQALKDKVLTFFTARVTYLLFLAVTFIMGIISFGAQYCYYSDCLRAAKLTTLIVLLAPIAYVDLKSRKIPNELLLSGLFARCVFYIIEIFIGRTAIRGILFSDMKGVLLGGGIFLIGALIAKNSIGMGDVKLFVMVGAFCGYAGTVSVMVFSLFLCFIVALVLLIMRKKSIKDSLPLAPFVFVGIFLFAVLG